MEDDSEQKFIKTHKEQNTYMYKLNFTFYFCQVHKMEHLPPMMTRWRWEMMHFNPNTKIPLLRIKHTDIFNFTSIITGSQNGTPASDDDNEMEMDDDSEQNGGDEKENTMDEQPEEEVTHVSLAKGGKRRRASESGGDDDVVAMATPTPSKRAKRKAKGTPGKDEETSPVKQEKTPKSKQTKDKTPKKSAVETTPKSMEKTSSAKKVLSAKRKTPKRLKSAE